MRTAGREVWEQRRDRAVDDLIAIRQQRDSGEIGAVDAGRLERRYQAEIADALAALDRAGEPGTGRDWKRVALAVGGFSIAAAVLVIALVNTVDTDSSPSTTFDLASVSNAEMEEVVAANPDVIPMRLALARRYVEEGNFSAALPHYLYILDRESNAEALMYVGWMTYLSGDAPTGESLLEESLSVAPEEPLASWFLANIRFYGLDDPAGAIEPLQDLLASGAAPEDITSEAQRMLDEATGP